MRFCQRDQYVPACCAQPVNDAEMEITFVNILCERVSFAHYRASPTSITQLFIYYTASRFKQRNVSKQLVIINPD